MGLIDAIPSYADTLHWALSSTGYLQTPDGLWRFVVGYSALDGPDVTS